MICYITASLHRRRLPRHAADAGLDSHYDITAFHRVGDDSEYDVQ